MDFYVYLHKKKTTGEVFYVGKGCGSRAWDQAGRSSFWRKVVQKHGYDVQIHSCRLQEWYAFELEKDLIAYYGRRQLGKGTLVNLSDGGEGTKGWIASQAFRDFRRNIMQREDAPNKDKRIWTFKNLNTGEEVSLTRYRFRKTYPNVLVNKICASGASSQGWVALENQTDFSINAKINGYKGIYNPTSDKNEYSITNVITGEVFAGLRQELNEKIGAKASALIREEQDVLMGWALTDKLLYGNVKLDQKGVNASNLDRNIYSFTNIETGEVFVGLRVEFEGVYGINPKPLFRGDRTCNKWAFTETVLQVGAEMLRNPTTGDMNVNADLTKHHFKHLVTGEEFVGTRNEFKNKFNLNVNELFCERKNLSTGNWCLVQNYEHAKKISKQDLTIYTFVHSTGKSFIGTRKQMKDTTGVCVKPLFASKSFLQTKGWALDNNAGIAFKRGQDKSEYTFIHDSGAVFKGTRREFEIEYDITCRILFYKNAKKKHKGWSLSPEKPE